jgi:rhodanese-related sulfurtransferase
MKKLNSREFVGAAGGGFILDVRTPAEFGGTHVAGARNLPLDQVRQDNFVARITELGWKQGDAIYLLCKSGQRATMAADRLQGLGLNLCVIEGGTDACALVGLPVNRGDRQVISLERQVRIVAGSLVLAGVLLGWLVNPACFVLSGFVGAGLVFAGVTDTCAMGMLLARMPWNRKVQGEAVCCSPLER